MKKYLVVITLITFLSCKENSENYEFDESAVVVDSSFQEEDNPIYIDSAAVPAFEDDYIETPKELTYEEAIVTNSIFDLKEYINKNPSHENIDLLNKRLIDLEVEKIYNDKNTGEMPTSEKIGSYNSTTSTVSISNDTSCELIIRYSGIDSKMISIPANQNRSLSIQSGSYRITASACGYNYAGSESLSGDYSSKYYISTSYR
jgi:hypothetical protein